MIEEMTPSEELEWASRQYATATEYLVSVLEKHEKIPYSITYALALLTAAITKEWENE